MARLVAAVCALGAAAAQYSWQEKWTTSFIDNFNAWGDLSTATYQQRYLVNDTWYKPGGPIFFYTGNEGDITLFAANTGFLWETAPSHNALVVFAEHRYYGESMPFGAASYDTPNLWALSSEQALADYAALLDSLKTNMSIPDAPVVSFGGSYGGERQRNSQQADIERWRHRCSCTTNQAIKQARPPGIPPPTRGDGFGCCRGGLQACSRLGSA